MTDTSRHRHASGKRAEYRPQNDYYTPKWVFQQLNIKFDLDVCAPINGVPWIPADNYYHEAIDGLTQNWYGKVWCNPPYSLPTPWVDKFIAHNNGLILVPFSRAKWFIKLWENADAIVALPNNFKFEHKDHGTKGVFMPVFLASLGDYCTDHLEASKIGKVR
jgi:hypothetical protein